MIPILIILAFLVIILISIHIKLLGIVQDLLDTLDVSLFKLSQIIELLKNLKSE